MRAGLDQKGRCSESECASADNNGIVTAMGSSWTSCVLYWTTSKVSRLTKYTASAMRGEISAQYANPTACLSHISSVRFLRRKCATSAREICRRLSDAFAS